MEAFDFENDHKWTRLYMFQQIKNIFRLIELFILLIFLTWAFHRLPSAVMVSGEYLRRLVKLVAGHLFVFFLANIIVLILFFKSRNLFMHNDFRDVSESIGNLYAAASEEAEAEGEEIVYQDKETILEVAKVRVHRRSRSENFRRECGGCVKKLRRSETETRRRVAAENEEEVVEEMSNEEFKKAIEEFIAKQVKFHQQEKLAIVLHGCN